MGILELNLNVTNRKFLTCWMCSREQHCVQMFYQAKQSPRLTHENEGRWSSPTAVYIISPSALRSKVTLSLLRHPKWLISASVQNA